MVELREIISLSKQLKYFPVYAVPTINGNANSRIIELIENWIDTLKASDIKITMANKD